MGKNSRTNINLLLLQIQEAALFKRRESLKYFQEIRKGAVVAN